MSDQLPTSLGAQYYTQLMEQISLQLTKTHQEIKGFLSEEMVSRNTLEEKTETINSLYEAIVFSTSFSPLLQKVFEGFSMDEPHRTLKEQIISLVEDLKVLWDKEMAKNIENKSAQILQEIGEKETTIKKAILERQEEIQALAQQVQKKAAQAQQITPQR